MPKQSKLINISENFEYLIDNDRLQSPDRELVVEVQQAMKDQGVTKPVGRNVLIQLLRGDLARSGEYVLIKEDELEEVDDVNVFKNEGNNFQQAEPEPEPEPKSEPEPEPEPKPEPKPEPEPEPEPNAEDAKAEKIRKQMVGEKANSSKKRDYTDSGSRRTYTKREILMEEARKTQQSFIEAIEANGWPFVYVDREKRWFHFELPNFEDYSEDRSGQRVQPHIDISPLKDGSEYSVSLYLGGKSTRLRYRFDETGYCKALNNGEAKPKDWEPKSPLDEMIAFLKEAVKPGGVYHEAQKK